jgi:rubredoxin
MVSCNKCAARGGVAYGEEPSMAEETYTFRCTVCGWEVTVDTPELPDDFVCEVCGVGPEDFELVDE